MYVSHSHSHLVLRIPTRLMILNRFWASATSFSDPGQILTNLCGNGAKQKAALHLCQKEVPQLLRNSAKVIQGFLKSGTGQKHTYYYRLDQKPQINLM